MTDEDIPAVAELEQVCFSEPWSQKSLKESLGNTNYRMLTAKMDGKTIGYVSTYLVADELNIANLAVDPAYRRMGIGWALLLSTIHLAKQNRLSTIYLEVRVSNQAAIALYEKAEFERCGIRKNFYDNPKEDGMMMRLDLEF
ncbi:MAG: ribosomal protein S18-alanine N-acetyltransferase [Lachnospiraceae bacterium]|nr:ribosomal protein S18-alanine N-acetyltransferase [Lachnospiraceae bacterium]